MSSKVTRWVWRKLSPAKWEDVWQERLGWLGQRLVIGIFGKMTTLRIEAHQLTRAEAAELQREFAGEIRKAKPLTLRDLEPRRRPPLRIRGKLTIVGSEKERGESCIVIPATVAFGTGEHATTATCLRMLADVSAKLHEWDALDLGTGSGILALAAKRLGAAKVEAADHDATAIRVARENAALNGVRGIVFKKLDVLKWRPARRWHVVLANVYGPVLIAAAPQISAAVAKGGRLILSGILREQVPEVLAAFRAQGRRFLRVTQRGKWATCLAA